MDWKEEIEVEEGLGTPGTRVREEILDTRSRDFLLSDGETGKVIWTKPS